MKKGFTLIELLLVMAILGTIIMLVIYHQRIINYKTIYNGYQKKATEDILNATNLVLYQYPSLKSFNDIRTKFSGITDTTLTNVDKIKVSNGTKFVENEYPGCGTGHSETPATCIRRFYKTVVKGNYCDGNTNTSGGCNIGSAFEVRYDGAGSNLTPPREGIRLKNGEVIMFGVENRDCNPCFVAYVDMNGQKGPNKYGQDRYRYFIFKNYVVHEDSRDEPYINTNALSGDELTLFNSMAAKWLELSSKKKAGNKIEDKQESFINCWNGQPFAKSKISECKDEYIKVN